MKSFFTYPLDFQTLLFPSINQSQTSGKFVAHFQLFKKISNLEGSVIKCGINNDEGFRRFSMFNEVMGNSIKRQMIAFEKFKPLFEEELNDSGSITLKVNGAKTLPHNIKESWPGTYEEVDMVFVPGLVCESIPEYLIENPELKIALLNIDLDDYEGTLTALEFFYPRLVSGGVLIIDNYYKRKSDYKAVHTYFHPKKIEINNFSVGKGPHFIEKA